MRYLSKISYLIALLFTAVFTMSAAWAGFSIWNSEYTVSKKELQETLSDKLPEHLGDKNTILLQLNNPVVGLNAPQNRIVITLDADIGGALLSPVHGQFTVSSGIRYDAKRLALTLVQPVIDHASFDHVDNETNQQLMMIGNMLMQQLFNGYPIYKFKPDQLKFMGQAYQPTTITVEEEEVKVGVEKVSAASNG